MDNYLKTSDFDYYLPEELIAQEPLENRSSSRLLVYNKTEKTLDDRRFINISEYLNPGDVLVLNNTKVIPARLFGNKVNHTFLIEVLLLKRINICDWEVILRPGRKIRIGDIIVFSDDLKAEVLLKKDDGVVKIRFFFDGCFETIIDRIGNMPLPPYIKTKLSDKSRYNTVYALYDGSAAAPTAGLHFTEDLLNQIRKKGVIIAPVTLHVGLGTFRPVKCENIKDHIMHTEHCEISEESAFLINKAKTDGKRIIAVGTTSVRTLESACNDDMRVESGCYDTSIFIYPGYVFKITDGIITNFHLPKSTLIMLVSAFIGRNETMDIYKHAVDEKYRFFSFGDSMLLI